jgi:hypothetical protein
MPEPRQDQQEQQQINRLAGGAEKLIDRRALLSTGRLLALPALVSLCVTREALGAAGSGDADRNGNGGSSGMMMVM